MIFFIDFRIDVYFRTIIKSFIFQTTFKMNQANNYLKNNTSIHSGKV